MPKPPPIKYHNGQTEQLAPAPLDVFELYQFVDHLVAGRTPDIVQLTVRRNAEWVKSIDFPSYLALAKWAINENFQKAMEIATHDPIAGLKVGPLLLQMGAVLKAMPAPELPPLPLSAAPGETSAATPPSAATTGNASSTTPAPAVAAAPTGVAS